MTRRRRPFQGRKNKNFEIRGDLQGYRPQESKNSLREVNFAGEFRGEWFSKFESKSSKGAAARKSGEGRYIKRRSSRLGVVGKVTILQNSPPRSAMRPLQFGADITNQAAMHCTRMAGRAIIRVVGRCNDAQENSNLGKNSHTQTAPENYLWMAVVQTSITLTHDCLQFWHSTNTPSFTLKFCIIIVLKIEEFSFVRRYTSYVFLFL